MSSGDHNNAKTASAERHKRPVHTLGDLRDFIQGSDLSEGEKAQICSAIKRADDLIGHGHLDLAADAQKVMAKLAQISPAMAGMTPGAWANAKSRVRKAFRLAANRLGSLRNRPPLSLSWQSLRNCCDDREWRDVSRFSHFANGQGWSPDDITDAHLERFRTHLHEVILVANGESVVRQTIGAWNKIATRKGTLVLGVLTPPEPKRTSYWVAQDELAQSLQDDIEKFLTEMSNPPLLRTVQKKARQKREGRRRPVRRKLQQGTVKQYGFVIVTMASALVAEGVELASITSLRYLVSPESLDRIMAFMHRRAGGRATAHMLTVAVRARKIAEWCDLSLDELELLDDLVARVKEDLPRKRGMTAKNKALIDRLDDTRFRDLIYLLPMMVVERARATKNRLNAARLVRTALAIELLLMCGMRRENLVPLELEKTIRRLGDGKNTYWVIDIVDEDVKNDEPLRFRLPDESVALLEYYLREWRPALCPTPTAWLFPEIDGQLLDEKTMTSNIQKATKRILGVSISTHQFRHIAAELYLRENPEGLDTVSQHLAHRDGNTTRHYYARRKQREASRIYQERVILDRAEAARRTRRRSPRRAKDQYGGDVL